MFKDAYFLEKPYINYLSVGGGLLFVFSGWGLCSQTLALSLQPIITTLSSSLLA